MRRSTRRESRLAGKAAERRLRVECGRMERTRRRALEGTQGYGAVDGGRLGASGLG